MTPPPAPAPGHGHRPSRTVGRLLGSGVWAVLDKALLGAAHFLLNVLLARWLPPAEYGGFTVAYTVFLLLATFHTALLTEPMLVFGSGKFRDRMGAYVRTLLEGHWIFGLAASLLLIAAGLVVARVGDGYLGAPLATFALAGPLILYQWLVRPVCYIERVPRVAVEAGTLYLGIMVAGVFALFQLGILNGAAAPLVMAAASLVSARWIVHRLRLAGATEADRVGLRSATRREHWQYGRWALAVAGLSWLAANVVFFTLPAFDSLEAVGRLRAGLNLILPVQQVLGALGIVVLPELVRAARRGALLGTTRWFTLALATAALLYGVLLYAFAEPLIGLLYGDRYPLLEPVLRVLALLPVSVAIVSVLAAALRAVERPRLVFYAYAASTTVALTAGIWLVYAHGVLGAALAMLLSSLATCAVLLQMLARHGRRATVTPSSEGAVP